MAFPYKKIIILGATFVIAVGRRKENLDLFVKKHGPARAAGIQFDICNLDEVQQFVADTSSNLALVPILRCSNYCASKTALHHWILCLREQLKETSVRVIEIFPPLVETELHDANHQPDMTKNRPEGIPVDEFADETMQKLIAGDDQIPVGFSRIAFNGWEQLRQQAFKGVVEMMRNSGN
ncbi:hypothetical protein N7449_008755 [Penicillium cf. viridicatum]|uniref:Uncharacterized protein n=1 Tax=Penicillium cf. viridicatum TaxID=2972119 RepID=A0A9W9J8U3_9EURO|nr:hypothetical protein N7449_008755 [Penicillium cf. viridicatum]